MKFQSRFGHGRDCCLPAADWVRHGDWSMGTARPGETNSFYVSLFMLMCVYTIMHAFGRLAASLLPDGTAKPEPHQWLVNARHCTWLMLHTWDYRVTFFVLRSHVLFQGWRSWNAFGNRIDENNFYTAIDAITAKVRRLGLQVWYHTYSFADSNRTGLWMERLYHSSILGAYKHVHVGALIPPRVLVACTLEETTRTHQVQICGNWRRMGRLRHGGQPHATLCQRHPRGLYVNLPYGGIEWDLVTLISYD